MNAAEWIIPSLRRSIDGKKKKDGNNDDDDDYDGGKDSNPA